MGFGCSGLRSILDYRRYLSWIVPLWQQEVFWTRFVDWRWSSVSMILLPFLWELLGGEYLVTTSISFIVLLRWALISITWGLLNHTYTQFSPAEKRSFRADERKCKPTLPMLVHNGCMFLFYSDVLVEFSLNKSISSSVSSRYFGVLLWMSHIIPKCILSSPLPNLLFRWKQVPRVLLTFGWKRHYWKYVLSFPKAVVRTSSNVDLYVSTQS